MSAIPIFWNYHIMFGISSYFWCWFQERLDINIWLESSQNLVLAAATAANSFNLLKYLLTSKLGFMFKNIKKMRNIFKIVKEGFVNISPNNFVHYSVKTKTLSEISQVVFQEKVSSKVIPGKAFLKIKWCIEWSSLK